MKRSFYLSEKIPKKTSPSDPVEWSTVEIYATSFRSQTLELNNR